MGVIQWFRKFFGLDPHLTQRQVYNRLLKKMATLASRGKVLIYKGGHRTLEEALFDPDNYVFIVIVQGKKFNKPKELKEWFQDYKM